MGEMRDKWIKAKKAMDTAKIDTKKLFKEDLGPSLDAYDVADQKYDALSGKAKQDALDAAKKVRKAAAEKAYKISASYIAAVKLFLSGVKDAHVKKALDDAQSVLAYHIAGEAQAGRRWKEIAGSVSRRAPCHSLASALQRPPKLAIWAKRPNRCCNYRT